MRRRIGGLACGATLLLALSPAVLAGSYLQSQGDLNSSTGIGYLAGDRGWDSRGKLQDLGCNSEYTFLSQYFEYGYSYYYTLFGGLNLADARCASESKTGLGDIRVGIRGRLDPTRNHRAWELELNIPTSSDRAGSARLGCGVFGLYAGVAAKEKINDSLSLGGEAGVQLWESPLSQQFEGHLSAGGPIGERRVSPWSWDVDVSGYAPLSSGDGGVTAGVSDCGTEGKLVRTGFAIGYALSPVSYMECGLRSGVWGEDSTRRQGVTCAFSRLFKR